MFINKWDQCETNTLDHRAEKKKKDEVFNAGNWIKHENWTTLHNDQTMHNMWKD